MRETVPINTSQRHTTQPEMFLHIHNSHPAFRRPVCGQRKKERKPLLKITHDYWLNFKTKPHTHLRPQMHTSNLPKHCLVFTSPPRKQYYTGRKEQSQTGHLTETPFNITRKLSSDTQNIIRISCFLWTLTSLPHEGDRCPQEKTLFLEHLCT